jgi:hypothetical protein
LKLESVGRKRSELASISVDGASILAVCIAGTPENVKSSVSIGVVKHHRDLRRKPANASFVVAF